MYINIGAQTIKCRDPLICPTSRIGSLSRPKWGSLGTQMMSLNIEPLPAEALDPPMTGRTSRRVVPAAKLQPLDNQMFRHVLLKSALLHPCKRWVAAVVGRSSPRGRAWLVNTAVGPGRVSGGGAGRICASALRNRRSAAAPADRRRRLQTARRLPAAGHGSRAGGQHWTRQQPLIDGNYTSDTGISVRRI